MSQFGRLATQDGGQHDPFVDGQTLRVHPCEAVVLGQVVDLAQSLDYELIDCAEMLGVYEREQTSL
jgi:hypothetical protein